jgi:hypothetical protein
MITKIEKLKNIGNFEDYTSSGDVTLKRMSRERYVSTQGG